MYGLLYFYGLNLHFSPSARSGLCPTGRDARPIKCRQCLLQALFNQLYKHFKTSKTFRFKLFSRKAKQKVQRLVVALEAPWRLTLPKGVVSWDFHGFASFSCSLTPAFGALPNPFHCVQLWATLSLCWSILRQLDCPKINNLSWSTSEPGRKLSHHKSAFIKDITTPSARAGARGHLSVHYCQFGGSCSKVWHS